MSIKILLVDDDEAFRAVTAIALAIEGCQVREASNGYAALETLEEDPPDVIVSDVEMPGLSGVELSRCLRAHPKLARIQLILLSALIEPDGTGTPQNHEADICLSKQLHVGELYQKIAGLVNASAGGSPYESSSSS